VRALLFAGVLVLAVRRESQMTVIIYPVDETIRRVGQLG
jgi:hypothetical protein